MANSEAGERIGGAGRRKNKQKEKSEGNGSKKRKGGCERPDIQTPKEAQSENRIRYTEVRKGKSPETKGRRDNIR